MSGFDRLLRFIEDETSFASSYYDEAYLDRRVSSRMRRTDTESYEEYLRLLQDSQEERTELLDALSVNVTSFFRDEKVWSRLRDVLVDLSEDRRSISVWSAACADGREPYSIGMLALDAGLSPGDIDILATDIDEKALESAKQGVYASTRTNALDEQLAFLEDPQQYVDRDGDRFAIRDRVKKLITFDRHDLITDDPKSGFDLVLCRNVCIYLDTEFKRPIIKTVSESLDRGGYLVLGQTETLPTDIKERFETADPRLRIYRKIESGSL